MPTLKALDKGHLLYWPESGNQLMVPRIDRMADGEHEFTDERGTWQISNIPRRWDGREIEVEVDRIEPLA